MDFSKIVRKGFTECATTPLIDEPIHQKKACAEEKEKPTGGPPGGQGETLLGRGRDAGHVEDH
jgi:hypothetical protein